MRSEALLNPSDLSILEEGVIAAFRPYIDEGAPGLTQVLRQSVLFATVDETQREIIIDRSAFLLAVLSVGSNPDLTPFPNLATWFAEWLRSRIEPSRIDRGLAEAETPPNKLLAAYQSGFNVIPSGSMRRLLPKAVQLVRQTTKRSEAALRHLFLAVATDPKHHLEIPALDWSLNEEERSSLTDHLSKKLSEKLDVNERPEVWRKIVMRIRAAPASPAGAKRVPPGSATTPTPAPAYLVSGFFADRTEEEDEEDDPLEIGPDVEAMARLICHENADPPISIGIFGGWGSGKSTFMQRLQKEIERLSEEPTADPDPSAPRFVSPIVQIRFNAWQFADANLWASLTAEFFDQLRAGGFRGRGRRIHAQLIEDVNEHVRGLSEDAVRSRAALNQADEMVRVAKANHDDALEKRARTVRQALVSELADSYHRNRGRLVRAGLLSGDTSHELSDFIAVAKEANSRWAQTKVVWRMVRAHWRPLAVLGALAAAILLLLSKTGLDAWEWLVAAVAAAAGILPTIWRLLRDAGTIIDELTPLASRLADTNQAEVGAVLEKEIALRVAEDEAEALRAAAERADRALARYIDPGARSNPPRVLRYLLEDEPETKAFEEEIGLMGRARRLFEALDAIVEHHRRENLASAGNHSAVSAAGEKGVGTEESAGQVPARIILYIDDLDRCTHEQVYKVLQAVHLLLAFRLFVVIVAVDVNWVLAAVSHHLEFTESENDNARMRQETTDKRHDRALEYLSKIFQLPFWLKPLSGKDAGRFANFVQSLTGPGQASPASSSLVTGKGAPTGVGAGPGSSSPKPAGGGGETSSPGSAGGSTVGRSSSRAEAKRSVESALKTMQLDSREVTFLAGSGIAAIASADPRGVKRLVNVYKIARARLSELDEGMILGDETRPPAYPLIAFAAALETGQPFATANAYYERLKTSEPEKRLIDLVHPSTFSAQVINAAISIDEARGGRAATAGEALEVARVVRRYSFNRYH